MVIAAPICFDPIAQMVGFREGGTHWLDYLKYAKFLGGDETRQYGSLYDWTIYWQGMVSRKIYYKQWFVNALKYSMLGLNVWYFFVRRNCFV